MKLFRLILLCFWAYFPLYAATDSEVVRYVSVRQVDGNKLTQIDSVTIQINNSKGEYASFINIPYSKAEKVSVDDARIEDIDGNLIRKLKAKEFSEESANPEVLFYGDRYVKTAQLRHHQYPYRISYSYKKQMSDFFQICHWSPVLYWNQNMRAATLIVDLPVKDYSIRTKYEYLDEPQVIETKDRIRYIWQINDFVAGKRESYAPFSALKIPFVKVVPLQFKYGVKGNWNSWVDFGNWICSLNENTTDLPAAEQQVVNQLLTGITDTKQKIRVLYQYLQNRTRYINVSVKTGGLKSYPASYVSLNKYGDCKALSTYMVALLKTAGIKAYYTLINAGDEIEPIDKGFPFQEFNHVIVTVPLEKDTLFLECTDKNIPMGYWGTFTQGRTAFVVKQDSSFFVQTPSLTLEDVACSSHVQLLVADMSVNSRMCLQGPAFEGINYLSSNQHNDRIKDEICNQLNVNAINVTSFDVKVNPEQLTQILLQAKLQASNKAKIHGDNIILSPISKLRLPRLESSEERKMDVCFNYPINRTDTIEYVFDKNISINKLPEDVFIESKYGNYTLKRRVDGDKFRITKKLLVFRGQYAHEEYDELYSFFSRVGLSEMQNYYLETQ